MKFSYCGIRVKNLDESLKFYTDIMGMKIVRPPSKLPLVGGTYVALKSPDSEQILELNYYEPNSPYAKPFTNGEDLDHLAFFVDDFEAAMKRFKEKGVKIAVERVDWWQRTKGAYILDPNGIWIEIAETTVENYLRD